MIRRRRRINKVKPIPKVRIVRKAKYVDPNRPRRWESILKRIPEDAFYKGVEVGVWRGDTGQRLLAARKNITHIMIDPWKAPGKNSRYYKSGDNTALKDQQVFDDCYQHVVDIIKEFGTRGIIIRKRSLPASKQFEDCTLDYVFIDGEHTYQAVKADIKAWLPKIKKGGFIAGHDYKNLPRFPGVHQAVDEIFGDKIELDGDHTWFVTVE